jgi:hypothetical protein
MLVAKLDDELKAVYERLFARELRAREEIRNSLSCIHVAELVAANLRGVDVPEIEPDAVISYIRAIESGTSG